METALRLSFAIAAGLALAWGLLVLGLLAAARKYPDTDLLKEAVRLLPDTVRLTKRLASDDSIPVGVRVRLWLLLAYLVSPLDLVPDFLPVVGYADDAVVIALTLRSVIRVAGTSALEKHWPGTPEGLLVLRRLCRLSATE